MSELNNDVSPEKAHALHRVVRAMHDGNCPRCGHLAESDQFYFPRRRRNRGSFVEIVEARHECPNCFFAITESEATAALKAFQPHMQANLEAFEEWRKQITPPKGQP